MPPCMMVACGRDVTAPLMPDGAAEAAATGAFDCRSHFSSHYDTSRASSPAPMNAFLSLVAITFTPPTLVPIDPTQQTRK